MAEEQEISVITVESLKRIKTPEAARGMAAFSDEELAANGLVFGDGAREYMEKMANGELSKDALQAMGNAAGKINAIDEGKLFSKGIVLDEESREHLANVAKEAPEAAKEGKEGEYIVEGQKEGGSLKWLTNGLRKGGWLVDALPLMGLDDLGAAVIVGVAGLIDTVAALAKGDKQLAKEEFAKGLAETGVMAIPFAEYGKVVGIDVQDKAREMAGSMVGSGVTISDEGHSSSPVLAAQQMDASRGRG